jgi:hypothetical protein
MAILSNCDTTAGWDFTSCTASIDTSDKKEGIGSLAVSVAASEWACYAGFTPTPFSGSGKFITFWFYNQDPSPSLLSMQLLEPDYSNYATFDFTSQVKLIGWNQIAIDLSAPTSKTGSPNIASITYIRFFLQNRSIARIYKFDDLEQGAPSGTVIVHLTSTPSGVPYTQPSGTTPFNVTIPVNSSLTVQVPNGGTYNGVTYVFSHFLMGGNSYSDNPHTFQNITAETTINAVYQSTGGAQTIFNIDFTNPSTTSISPLTAQRGPVTYPTTVNGVRCVTCHTNGSGASLLWEDTSITAGTVQFTCQIAFSAKNQAEIIDIMNDAMYTHNIAFASVYISSGGGLAISYLNNGTMQSGTDLLSSITIGTRYNIELDLKVGSGDGVLQAYIWPVGGTKPTTPTLQITGINNSLYQFVDVVEFGMPWESNSGDEVYVYNAALYITTIQLQGLQIKVVGPDGTTPIAGAWVRLGTSPNSYVGQAQTDSAGIAYITAAAQVYADVKVLMLGYGNTDPSIFGISHFSNIDLTSGAAILPALTTKAIPSPPTLVKGNTWEMRAMTMCLTLDIGSSAFTAALDDLIAKYGDPRTGNAPINTIELRHYWHQNSTTLMPEFNDPALPWTKIVTAINACRSRGFDVLLCLTVTWGMSFSFPSDLTAFFNAYANLCLTDIAQCKTLGVKYYLMAFECPWNEETYNSYWQTVIDKIRIAAGPKGSSNPIIGFNGVSDTRTWLTKHFWWDVDFLHGWGWARITSGSNPVLDPTDAQFTAGWMAPPDWGYGWLHTPDSSIKNVFDAANLAWQKGVWSAMNAGLDSADGANVTPWTDPSNPLIPDPSEACQYWKAFFQLAKNTDGFNGCDLERWEQVQTNQSTSADFRDKMVGDWVKAGLLAVSGTPITTVNITVTSAGNGTVAPSGQQTLTIGATYTNYFAALPNQYYQLDYWDFNGTNLGSTNPLASLGPVTLAMDGGTLTAHFKKIVATITVSVNDAAMGTTNPAPGGYTVNEGDQGSITAIPNANYRLDHWELDGVNVGNTNPFTLLVTKVSYTLVAVFARNTISLNVAAGPNGSVSPSGLLTLNVGQTYQFTATPNQYYQLGSWMLGSTQEGSANPFSLTISAAMNGLTLTATFVNTPSTITISVNDANMGTTTPVPGTYSNFEGYTETVTSIANPGYHIYQWILDGSIVDGSNVSYNVTLTKTHHDLQVVFVENAPSITVQPRGPISKTPDSTQDFTASVSGGHGATIVTWYDDLGNNYGTGTAKTIALPAQVNGSSTYTIHIYAIATDSINQSGTSNKIQVDVAPPPPEQLVATVTADPKEINQGGTSTITVHVTANDVDVNNVHVTLNSTGGTLATTDGYTNANGDFQTTFTDLTLENVTITATVDLTGYTTGTGQGTVNVTPKQQGFPWWAVPVGLAAILGFYALSRRGKKP